jgi:hypothetical protein
MQNAFSAVAKTRNGDALPIKGAVSLDQENDLALLAVEGRRTLPFLALGNSESVQTGDHVAVIGSPLGLEGSLSEGIVSAKRGDGNGKRKLLQITAAISPGSSGSPVLDSSGKVIGIATAEMREGQSVNFAVPAEIATQLLRAPKPTGGLIPLSQLAYGFAVEREGDFAESELEVRRSPEYSAAEQARDEAGLSVALHQQTDWEKVLSSAKTLIAKYPNSASANDMLGNVYNDMGFQEDAIEAFQKVVKLDPDSPGAWASLGSIYKEKGKLSQADFAFSQAIAYQTKWVEHRPPGTKKALALMVLSEIYYSMGNEELANRIYQQALQERERKPDWFEQNAPAGPTPTPTQAHSR